MSGEQRTTTESGRQQVLKRRSRSARPDELVDEVSPASTPAAWRWTNDLPVGPARRGR
ncbi:MAG: hypothetical protein ABWZ26_03525 [Candidatus Nanopelagicales bacterium]